jgi:hypothetical protein
MKMLLMMDLHGTADFDFRLMWSVVVILCVRD